MEPRYKLPHRIMKINIGLVDDHQLFLKSLWLLISRLPDFDVVVDAAHGKELQEKFEAGSPLPDILLIDVNMPVMDGAKTAQWMHQVHPSVRLVALSMANSEQTIIEMIKAGCCSYLLKNTHPDELAHALKEIYSKNFYNSDINKINLSEILIGKQNGSTIHIGERELEFLHHATNDITYKQIAQLMDVSERTVDGYRGSLFIKFQVQNRTGMVLEAIRRRLVKI